jgi:hypothetical protein
VDDLVGLLDGDTLVLAQRRVLVGELIAQLAGPRVDHRRLVEIDTEFGCAQADPELVAKDGQIRDPALQHPPGRLEDAIVVAFKKHNPRVAQRRHRRLGHPTLLVGDRQYLGISHRDILAPFPRAAGRLANVWHNRSAWAWRTTGWCCSDTGRPSSRASTPAAPSWS